MPWSAEALVKIKNFAVSKEFKAGFAKLREFETQANPRYRSQIQLQHLLAIADHEQGVILQPLIYDDTDFVWWLKQQRSLLVNWASPALELVFTHACATGDSALKSVAPAKTQLESFTSRMIWIRSAANDFHILMQQKTSFMEGQISTIAGCSKLADR